MEDALPFLAVMVIIAAGPVLDTLWTGSYKAFYEREFPDAQPPAEQLLIGTRWAADISQAIPTSVISIIGVASLLQDDVLLTSTVLLLIEAVALAAVALVASRQEVHTQRRLLYWTPLQAMQWALNGAGVALALLL